MMKSLSNISLLPFSTKMLSTNTFWQTIDENYVQRLKMLASNTKIVGIQHFLQTFDEKDYWFGEDSSKLHCLCYADQRAGIQDSMELMHLQNNNSTNASLLWVSTICTFTNKTKTFAFDNNTKMKDYNNTLQKFQKAFLKCLKVLYEWTKLPLIDVLIKNCFCDTIFI